MDLTISKQECVLSLDIPNGYILGTPNNALGNIISVLNDEFPGVAELSSSEYANLIASSITSGVKQVKEIWGLKCTPDQVFNINEFLNNSDRWSEISKNGVKEKGKFKIDLTLQDVEIWRVRHHIKKSATPSDWLNIDYSQGLIINDVTSIYDVVYGLLYYYAFNGLKLVKCEHCGRWFATSTLKNKYCSRKSTFPGYTHLNCEQAVRNIMQNCGRIKNRIDIKAAATPTAQLHTNAFVNDFFKQCEPLYLSVKESPTVENLSKYHAFLKKTEKERGWIK